MLTEFDLRMIGEEFREFVADMRISSPEALGEVERLAREARADSIGGGGAMTDIDRLTHEARKNTVLNKNMVAHLMVDLSDLDLDAAPVFQKSATVQARPSIFGERLVTTLADGTVETDRELGIGQMVITQPEWVPVRHSCRTVPLTLDLERNGVRVHWTDTGGPEPLGRTNRH